MYSSHSDKVACRLLPQSVLQKPDIRSTWHGMQTNYVWLAICHSLLQQNPPLLASLTSVSVPLYSLHPLFLYHRLRFGTDFFIYCHNYIQYSCTYSVPREAVYILIPINSLFTNTFSPITSVGKSTLYIAFHSQRPIHQ